MPSAQQRSAVPLDQQSVLPTVRGVPWWGAVLVATVVTGIGAAIDASNTEGLGAVFKFCYLLGCVTAALAVRRRALFTAAAQPPLIAFLVGVITLYGLNAEQASSGVRGLIFQVLLPIANDFPWMALTFVVTLGLVLARWFLTREPTTGDRRRVGGPKRPTAPTEGSTPRNRAKPKKNEAAKSATSPAATAKGATAKGPSAKRSATVKGEPAKRESANREATPGAATSRTATPERKSRPAPKNADRPSKPTAKDPARRAPTNGAPEGLSTESPAPAKPNRAVPRPRPEAPAGAQRSTAGAVFRAGAGEQIDAIDGRGGQVAAPASTIVGSADDDRYVPAARQAAPARYQSTRGRNRA
ncbi:DUF6542 domain-containing protein [Gordonia sp. LSe1-13]|uniref:DUF6542 domain-containing protein n=1 Tax=Gordonia sesuvii TaxID=3116777 RepID=A0ABU7MIA6_9ACTN|nr:DUF6542 domain-containing protein [Gordonia sp. LSe1-13]